jgi:D-alanyl-D-alanine carboxypeptidase
MCFSFRQKRAALFTSIPPVSYTGVLRNEHGGQSGLLMFLSTLRFFSITLAILTNHACIVQTFAAGNEEIGGRVLPIGPQLCQDMKTHGVLTARAPLACERLKLVKFSYIDFNGNIKTDGRAVVLDAISQQVLELFTELKNSHFPIGRAELMDVYDGDDDASMDNNNTSSFNDRNIAGTNNLSLHAYGAAIDINPRQNPNIISEGEKVAIKPALGADYVQRSVPAPGMAEQAVPIFARHGFVIWGGAWNNPKDYQHFQLDRGIAEKLVELPAEQASEYFNAYVSACRSCLEKKPGISGSDLALCAANPEN